MAKVVNINPIEHLKEQEVQRLIKRLQEMELTELHGLFIATQYKNAYEADIIGFDFGLKGYIETQTKMLGEQLIDFATEESAEDLT